MTHASLKLIPGIDTTRTPALNEAAISSCQFIRFMPDRMGQGLVQKLGGWSKFYPTAVGATVRALHAWADTNDNSHLAIGTEEAIATLTNGVLTYRNPQEYEADVAANVLTTAGSSRVTINDFGSNVTSYDSVYIKTPISVGGVVLSGFYQTIAQLPDSYQIIAKNVIGQPVLTTQTAPADLMTGMAATAAACVGTTATVDFTGNYLVPVGSYVTVAGITPSGYNGRWRVTASTAGATSTVSFVLPAGIAIGTVFGTVAYIGVPVFATTTDQISVTVSLAGHGLSVGSTFAVLVATNVGGITISRGNYLVQSVTNANEFVITAANAASSTATARMNGGDARYRYYIGQNAIGAALGYGSGGYGYGGYGSGVMFDGGREMAVTGGSSVGTLATLTFAEDIVVPVGSEIIVAGVSPSGYNSPTSGTWTVTASVSGSVSFRIPSHIASSASGGSITVTHWAFLGADDWALDNFGEYLIASPHRQEVFFWAPEGGATDAQVVPNAPLVNEGVFVAMPERQLVAYGSTFTGIQDPLLVRWTTLGDITTWVGSATNQAGSYRISKGSMIVGGMQGPQQALLWTDLGVWAMQYINFPLVWSFNEIADGCGLIGRKAMGTMGGSVYWMSQSQFFRLAGGGVEPIMCPVWDVVFQDLDTDYAQNIRCAPNSRFGEVAWYFPTIGSGGSPSKYVKYNVALNQWDYGSLARTAWIDQSVLGPPIGASAGNFIQQHETSMDADGDPMLSNFRTGYFALSDGDWKTFVDQVWPDMKWGFFDQEQIAQVRITFFVADYPGQTPVAHGPYTVTQATEYITPRFRGRLVAIQVSSNDLGSFWRLGNIRYRLAQDGRY